MKLTCSVRDCFQTEPRNRPLFDKIYSRLETVDTLWTQSSTSVNATPQKTSEYTSIPLMVKDASKVSQGNTSAQSSSGSQYQMIPVGGGTVGRSGANNVLASPTTSKGTVGRTGGPPKEYGQIPLRVTPAKEYTGMPTRQFQVGDRIRAIWSGDGNWLVDFFVSAPDLFLRYEATVKTLETGGYKVAFTETGNPVFVS